MGSACIKQDRTVAFANYDVKSGKVLDHFTLGETLGRGAFGVVKAATMKPHAKKALDDIVDISTVTKNVARRKMFANRPLAVKVMRQDKNSSEGDSCDRLDLQIQRLDTQASELQKTIDASSLQNFEELNWLNEYTDNLRAKLAEKRKTQTKKTPREMMMREVTLLEKCTHHFIIQLVETFEDDNLFCVIFERCYGNVASRYPNGVLATPIVARQACQLLSAVSYLHSFFLLHRDIKPENLLFRTPNQDSAVLLGDFGMAVELRKAEDRCQGCAGTPHFVPPEGFHSYYQSFPSDVWACGCTVYWMLLGVCPFEVSDEDTGRRGGAKGQNAKSFQTTAIFNMWRSTRMSSVLGGWKPQFEHDMTAMLARKICHPREEPSFLYHSGEPLNNTTIADLLTAMLNKDPRARVTVDDALGHSWLASAKAEVDRDLQEFARRTQQKLNQTQASAVPDLHPIIPTM
jgi:serine/threonine protein kinase